MTTLMILALGLLAIGVIGLMAVQYLTGRNDLLSIRNYFLLGFIVFQLTSAIFPLATGEYGQYPLSNLAGTSVKYVIWAVVFLVVMFWAYKHGFGVKRLARMTPAPSAPPGSAGLLLLAFAFTVLAIPMRLAVAIPLISSLSNHVGVGLAAVACGLLGWVWGPRLMNPVMLFPALPILAVNAANVVTGSFGRRALVAIGAGLIWGMYFSRWRYLKPWGVMWRLAAVAAVPALVIVLFTSARSSKEHERSALQHLQAIEQVGNIKSGLQMILDGQGTATTSMWLMENFPKSFEYNHMFMLRYFFYYPVPRTLWPDKPTPLSGQIANLAHRRHVDRDKLTIGPGILGHAAADGGWYALIVYAIVMGLLLRYFDEIIMLNSTNALAVMPIGCTLGQVLGLARGETSAFAFILVFTVVSVYIIMMATAAILRMSGLTKPGEGGLGWPEEDEDDHVSEDGMHDGYTLRPIEAV
ncbi:MAG: WzyE family oligosaccharide polymerase [Phycisphaerales bacterium]|nr:WzyE family oligosaccharide polymerase [Phycisphaerales bacterium]